MHSYSHCGAVHISLVGYEHFAEVVGLASLLQDLALEVAEGRVSPARTTAVLGLLYPQLLRERNLEED